MQMSARAKKPLPMVGCFVATNVIPTNVSFPDSRCAQVMATRKIASARVMAIAKCSIIKTRPFVAIGCLFLSKKYQLPSTRSMDIQHGTQGRCDGPLAREDSRPHSGVVCSPFDPSRPFVGIGFLFLSNAQGVWTSSTELRVDVMVH